MEVEQIKIMGMRIMSAVRRNNSPPPSGEALVQNLQDSAEACQETYGNKQSLATDQDLRVAGMCDRWVKVLSHGLRVPTSNSYQPIQTLITAGLNFAFNLNLLDTCLWNYTKLHLTRHEEDRFKLLKTVNTPLGYFKAFLRSALNEKSLERYLLSWTSHPILKEYYEDWAALRDVNLAKKLPDIAAGLSSIFFAMSIDRADLNESHLVNEVETYPEPVVPLSAPLVKTKVNRRTIRQIISFDSEENLNEEFESQVKNSTNVIEISSMCNEEADEINRLSDQVNDLLLSDKLLASDSGSHQDSDVSSMSGEMKRISESRDNDRLLELNVIDDEIFEIDDEIKSNKMEHYEQNTLLKMKMEQLEDEHKERSDRMETAIVDLTRENNKLKEQLRNYVSAVETLNQDGQSDEIKHYEAKLIEVAQMHAELMEFNEMLQRQLQRQIEPFGAHYPLSSFTGIPESCINIWIPSTYLISKASKSFHVYQVFLKVGIDEWNVYRRYSEFRKLYGELKNMHPDISTVKFPPKKTLGKREAWLVEQRRIQLQGWLRHIIHALPQLQQSNSRRDLITQLPFFSDPGNYDYSGVLRPLSTP